jgi:hypothetical protein
LLLCFEVGLGGFYKKICTEFSKNSSKILRGFEIEEGAERCLRKVGLVVHSGFSVESETSEFRLLKNQLFLAEGGKFEKCNFP